MSDPSRRRQYAARFTAAVVVAVLVPSCSTEGPRAGDGPADQPATAGASATASAGPTGAPPQKPPSRPPSTTPDAGPGPATTGAVEPAQEVLRAYERFWAVAQVIDRQPAGRWRAVLSTVAGEPLLDQLLDGLRGQRSRGQRQYGTVRLRPRVVDLSGTRAVVADCQDASGSGLLSESTGTVEEVGSARTPFAAVLLRDRAGTWLVAMAQYLRDGC